MSIDDDLPADMHRFDLDDTVLDGGLLPDDAPPALADVAALARAAQADPSPGELVGEDRIVAEIAAVLTDAAGVPDSGRTPLLARIARAKVATIIAASVIGLGAAAAAVATGARPSSPARVSAAAGTSTTLFEVTIPTSEPTTSDNSSTTTEETTAASTTTTEAPGTKTPASGPQGPDATGPAAFGLCTAWHDGRETGQKLDAPPFVNLAIAATQAGMSVTAYCDEVFAAKQAEHATPPSGTTPAAANGHGNGNGNGHGPGNGNGKGHGNGNGNGNGHSG